MTVFMDLIVSTLCIIVTLNLSNFLRKFISQRWSKDLIGQVLIEFVAAFELTAVAFESSVLLRIGGVPLFALSVFLVWYWRTQNWHGVTGSPSSSIEQWVTRRIGVLSLIITVLAQLAGGFISYRYYNTLYWRLGLSDAHSAKIHDGFEQCRSNIKTVPWLAACAEALIIFTFLMGVKLVLRIRSLKNVAGLLISFLGTSLVLLTADICGGYFNPVLASAVQFGCTGSTLMEHLLVYWVGITVGTLAAYYVGTLLVNNTKTKDDEKVSQKLD